MLSSERIVIVAKVFLKLPDLLMLTEQKNLSLPTKLAHVTFAKLLIASSTTVNLLFLLFLIVLRCYLLYMIKTKTFAENFSKNSNL